MRYTLYRLTAEGRTPTEGITCEMHGCQYVKDGDNLAYLTGTTQQIDDTLAACNFTELSEQQAKVFAASCMPVSTIDMMGNVFYPQPPIVEVDGTIRVPWSDAPFGTPDQAERLEAVETAVLDLVLGG